VYVCEHYYFYVTCAVMWVNVSTNTMMKALANGVCDYWIKSLDANQIKCCKETFEWKWKTKKLMETYLEVEDKKKKKEKKLFKIIVNWCNAIMKKWFKRNENER
jgi:response regulator of citrate/malate metabolism